MTTERKFNVAVAGATGAVGNQMISCLEERKFPINSIKLLASSRSVGRKIDFRGRAIAVEELKETSELFKSAVSSSLLSGVIGVNDFLHQAGMIPDLTNQLFKTFAPTLQHQLEQHQPFNETEWYWFDL